MRLFNTFARLFALFIRVVPAMAINPLLILTWSEKYAVSTLAAIDRVINCFVSADCDSLLACELQDEASTALIGLRKACRRPRAVPTWSVVDGSYLDGFLFRSTFSILFSSWSLTLDYIGFFRFSHSRSADTPESLSQMWLTDGTIRRCSILRANFYKFRSSNFFFSQIGTSYTSSLFVDLQHGAPNKLFQFI